MLLFDNQSSQFIFLYLGLKDLSSLIITSKESKNIINNNFYRKYWIIILNGRDYKLKRNYLLDIIKKKYKKFIFNRRYFHCRYNKVTVEFTIMKKIKDIKNFKVSFKKYILKKIIKLNQKEKKLFLQSKKKIMEKYNEQIKRYKFLLKNGEYFIFRLRNEIKNIEEEQNKRVSKKRSSQIISLTKLILKYKCI